MDSESESRLRSPEFGGFDGVRSPILKAPESKVRVSRENSRLQCPAKNCHLSKFQNFKKVKNENNLKTPIILKKNLIASMPHIQGATILSVNIFRGDREPIGEH